LSRLPDPKPHSPFLPADSRHSFLQRSYIFSVIFKHRSFFLLIIRIFPCSFNPSVSCFLPRQVVDGEMIAPLFFTHSRWKDFLGELPTNRPLPAAETNPPCELHDCSAK
jgi:hypothetical protein